MVGNFQIFIDNGLKTSTGKYLSPNTETKMNLDNQLSFDIMSEVLQAITKGDDIEQQINRLTDVERLYLKTLMDLTPEQQEEWVNV